MVFDKELKLIEEAKNKVALRCELRRRLAPLEFRGIRSTMRRSFSMMTMAVTVGGLLFEIMQRVKRRR